MKTPFYLPTLWGYEGDDDTPDPDDTPDEPEAEESPETPDAEAIAAKASARAARKAKREQAEELGFGSAKEMKEFFDKAKKEAEERKTEEEQRLEAIAQREKELNDRDIKIREQALKLSIKAALADSGINSQRTDKAEVLITSGLTPEDLEDEDTAAIIKEAVASLKKDTPEWFGKGATLGSNDASDDGDPEAEKSEQEKVAASVREDLIRRGMTFN